MLPIKYNKCLCNFQGKRVLQLLIKIPEITEAQSPAERKYQKKKNLLQIPARPCWCLQVKISSLISQHLFPVFIFPQSCLPDFSLRDFPVEHNSLHFYSFIRFFTSPSCNYFKQISEDLKLNVTHLPEAESQCKNLGNLSPLKTQETFWYAINWQRKWTIKSSLYRDIKWIVFNVWIRWKWLIHKTIPSPEFSSVRKIIWTN